MQSKLVRSLCATGITVGTLALGGLYQLGDATTASATPPALTLANIEVTPSSSAPTTDSEFTQVVFSGTPSAQSLNIQWNGPADNAGFITLSGLGTLQPGQTYQTQDQSGIFVGATPTSCGGNGYNASVEIDQLAFSDTNTVSHLALTFDCQSDDGNIDIYGTVAYNATPTTPGEGYYVYGQSGELEGFGNDNFLTYLGDLTTVNLNAPIVGMATTPDDGGYWMVGADGGVFSYGDAPFYGSTGNLKLNKPIVGMAATPDGKGYWFVASDGGVFSYGDAGFYGSTGNLRLNKPVVGMVATPDGKGYWLVASDGGIFSYGDAKFYGSTGNLKLNKPIVGMTTTPDGKGYNLVASDGGIFAYGDAKFYGSTGNLKLDSPIVGMHLTQDAKGYWLVAADGGIFAYGDAQFAGSLGGQGVTDVAGLTS